MVSRMLYPVQMLEKEFFANPKWMMRNGYVHGVVRNDSLKYEKINDTLHFVLQYRSIMFAPSDKSVCKWLNDNKVVINFMEKTDRWTCMVLERTAKNEIFICHLDHDAVKNILSSLGSLSNEPGSIIPTILASPNRNEFLKFVDEGGFDSRKLKYEPLVNFGG